MNRFQCAGMFVLVSAAILAPEGARAQSFLLDSGTPTSGSYPILNNADWYAAEFYAYAGETVTELSVYLTSMTGNGDNFAFDIYSNGGGSFLSTRNSLLSPFLAYSATGTFSAAGWNTTNVDWTVPASGDYWLAVEGDTAGAHNLPNFDLEAETSATTGTAPAVAFAYDTGTQFRSSGSTPIGLEVTAAAVPEPSGWWFLAGGGFVLSGLRGFQRRITRVLNKAMTAG